MNNEVGKYDSVTIAFLLPFMFVWNNFLPSLVLRAECNRNDSLAFSYFIGIFYSSRIRSKNNMHQEVMKN